ncbi:hypothetical protein [Sphingobacterium daejeonense]|uniref:hypothetical protein n=1 Tax=Sphingobacterium daejeonense TaxID=371142 RepID=UPI0010C488E5|nr:DNA methylase [Sphingobacterium daejeonense]
MSQKEGVDIRVNRFFIQGEGTIKYTFNNGVMAKDPETASLNFIKALEKLPTYIRKEQENMADFQKNIPILKEVINGTWTKENRLSELKTELAAIERKIQLSNTPEPIENSTEQVEKPARKSKGYGKRSTGQKVFICHGEYCKNIYPFIHFPNHNISGSFNLFLDCDSFQN